MTDPDATPITPESTENVDGVYHLLEEYAKAIERAQQLEAWLENTDDQYKDLQAEKARISDLEDKIKVQMKESAGWNTKVENSGYEAVMIVRCGKPEITWDLHEIKKEPWAAAVIIETVDKGVFDLLVKSGRIEKENIELYCQTEPGTKTKAVTIRKIEDKKP